MAIKVDPEQNEISAMLNLSNFNGQQVLEIGCGDGRLTWRYADLAGHVTAIDPFGKAIARAKEDTPDELKSRVEFHHISFEDFANSSGSSVFDRVILSWSLC